MTAHRIDCPDCLGTGIGWNGPESSCTNCRGRGSIPCDNDCGTCEDLACEHHLEPKPDE